MTGESNDPKGAKEEKEIENKKLYEILGVD